jgi:hypothetical protein
MIQAGQNIQQKDDLLKKVNIDYLYKCIQSPKPEISALIRQVRMIRTLDIKQYSKIKRSLPYFVCGIFNPPYRRTENFAYINYFILDIDHISEKGLNIEDIKNMAQKDERVVMCFLSPSEDGLKIMFKFDEKCYDSGIYSLFYKVFSKQIASEYHIEQVIDTQTCDVCRACFISEDSHIYYNPNAIGVNINAFIDLNNPFEVFQIKTVAENEIIHHKSAEKDVEKSIDPDTDVILKIKEILNPSLKNKMAPPPVFIPRQLEEIMGDLSKYIEDTGVIITDIININYGKKIRFKTSLKTAEVNIFYGKRGFSVVRSPKSGTSEEFNKLMADLIQNFINENFLI